MSEWLEGPGSATLDAHPNVALFRSARRCFETVKAWHEWGRALGVSPLGPSRQDSSGLAEHAAEKLRVLARERLSVSPGQALLDESESFELFGAAGISCPHHMTATSAAAARTCCAEVGFPAVMKILSDEISHKSNAGGVILHIGDEAQAEAAYRRLQTTFGPQGDGVDVLVEKEIRHAAELIVGIKRDVHFGRTVVVGVGGTDVERTDVTMVDLLPVDEQRLGKFLLGVGIDASAVSPQAVCGVLSGLNAIMNSCENVAEIDINPLVVDESVVGTPHRLIALDGVIVLRDMPVDDNGSATGRRREPQAR
jgi:succinyl-CoA synthetase beta subunit